MIPSLYNKLKVDHQMHYQNTPLKVYESRRLRSICQKARSSRERERETALSENDGISTRSRKREPSVWSGHPPRFGIVASFGLPAFYNAEVAAVFSAALCFLSLSLCAPPASSKALLQQQQHRPLFVLSRSLLLGSSRIFYCEKETEIRSAS